MRERARDKGRLEDIVEYSANVMMLIKDYSFEALISDKRTYFSQRPTGTSGNLWLMTSRIQTMTCAKQTLRMPEK